MRQGCFGLLALTAMLWNSPAAEAEWLYKTIQGSTGKTKTSFASHRFGGAGNTYTIVVRCQGSVLDAYVDFNEYLGANLRPVSLKVDKETAVQELLTLEAAVYDTSNFACFTGQHNTGKTFCIFALLARKKRCAIRSPARRSTWSRSKAGSSCAARGKTGPTAPAPRGRTTT